MEVPLRHYTLPPLVLWLNHGGARVLVHGNVEVESEPHNPGTGIVPTDGAAPLLELLQKQELREGERELGGRERQATTPV